MSSEDNHSRATMARRARRTCSCVVVSLVLVISHATFAFDATTDYVYDNLNQLKQVTFNAAVNGKPPRMLYAVTYTYDKNGNRVGMVRTAGAPEIDSVHEIQHTDTTITFQILGVAFQVGTEVTLTLCGSTQVTGTVLSLTPVSAVVQFDIATWPSCDASMTVTTPDDQTFTFPFSRTALILSVTAVGPGSVTQYPPPPYYPSDVVELTAMPDGSATFDGWTGDITSADTTIQVAMSSDVSVTATFSGSSVPATGLVGLTVLTIVIALCVAILLQRSRKRGEA